MAQPSRADLDQARSEREKFVALKQAVAPYAMFGMLNKAQHVLDIAQHTLDAKIAAADKKSGDAEKLLRHAVALEDDLTYMEPPDWLMPTRESLGGLLLRSGKAGDAEKIFRED